VGLQGKTPNKHAKPVRGNLVDPSKGKRENNYGGRKRLSSVLRRRLEKKRNDLALDNT